MMNHINEENYKIPLNHPHLHIFICVIRIEKKGEQ